MFSRTFFFFLFVTLTVSLPQPRGYFRRIGIPLATELEKSERLRYGSRILGGTPTNLQEHPYVIGVLVHLKSGLTAVATASIITPTGALYAAHCWNDGLDYADSLTLVFGSEFVFFGGVRVDTDDVEVHENWNPSTNYNDIAVIRHERVEYTDVIQPMVLPIENYGIMDYTGHWVTVSGFGRSENGLAVAMSVKKQMISNEQCSAFFSDFITDNLICTSGAEGASLCSGDTGGPLTLDLYGPPHGENVQIGISVLSMPGCIGGFPSGYTRVASYFLWISQRVSWA